MYQDNNVKQRILDKAKELIARKGFSGLKTDELARETGISKRTLYEQFASKKQLFATIIDSELDKHSRNVSDIILNIENDENCDFMKELSKITSQHIELSKTFTKEFLQDAEKYYPELFNKLSGYRYEKMLKGFNKISFLGRKKGFFIENYNEKMVFFLNLIIFDHVLTPEIIAELPLSLEEIISSINEILLMGLLTDKGREEFRNNMEKLTTN